MTEAPDVYRDSPDDEESAESGDQGVEGLLDDAAGRAGVTGDPLVDAVLDSLSALDDRPVGEHAAVFEAVHERLRAALEADREPA
jgi:hypothetical protein